MELINEYAFEMFKKDNTLYIIVNGDDTKVPEKSDMDAWFNILSQIWETMRAPYPLIFVNMVRINTSLDGLEYHVEVVFKKVSQTEK